jgi:hypothetical protein
MATTSQVVAAVLLVVFIVCYFGANTPALANAFIYLFSIAGIVLIVGNISHYIDCLFMDDRTFEY